MELGDGGKRNERVGSVIRIYNEDHHHSSSSSESRECVDQQISDTSQHTEGIIKWAGAALTQCETRWRALLASFHDRYGKLIADHPDAKKDLDLLRASVAQIGQLIQNSPEVNGNGAEWT
jgi:hypothetical protein